MTLGGVH